MNYEEGIRSELAVFEREMLRPEGFVSGVAKGVQKKVNGWIPDKIHRAVTAAIEGMVKAVLFGTKYVSRGPLYGVQLRQREHLVDDATNNYRKVAMVEGWSAGAAGFVGGVADFPLFLGIKMKFLFEVAGLYGYDVKNFKERLFILYVFQLAFSSQQSRRMSYQIIKSWKDFAKNIPENEDSFDWRHFQQEYRDYIDLAKLLQVMPVIGSLVGAYTNHKLVEHLGRVAKNAYRLRWFSELKDSGSGF